jgi:hypothetical protein
LHQKQIKKMKKTIVIAAMLPFAALAQNTGKQPGPKLKSFTMHFETMQFMDQYYGKTKTTMSIPGCTEMNFGIDTGISPVQQAAKSAIQPDWNHGYFTAEHVTIICTPIPGVKAAYPDLKADYFVYDNLSDKGRLSGHVTIVDNGAEKEFASVVFLDFSHDKYEITGIK